MEEWDVKRRQVGTAMRWPAEGMWRATGRETSGDSERSHLGGPGWPWGGLFIINAVDIRERDKGPRKQR